MFDTGNYRKRREGKVVQLQFEVVTLTVKLSPKGEGRLDVQCNRKITVLVRVSGHQLLGQRAMTAIPGLFP